MKKQFWLLPLFTLMLAVFWRCGDTNFTAPGDDLEDDDTANDDDTTEVVNDDDDIVEPCEARLAPVLFRDKCELANFDKTLPLDVDVFKVDGDVIPKNLQQEVGEYTVKGVCPGEHVLVIEKAGYLTDEGTLEFEVGTTILDLTPVNGCPSRTEAAFLECAYNRGVDLGDRLDASDRLDTSVPGSAGAVCCAAYIDAQFNFVCGRGQTFGTPIVEEPVEDGTDPLTEAFLLCAAQWGTDLGFTLEPLEVLPGGSAAKTVCCTAFLQAQYDQACAR